MTNEEKAIARAIAESIGIRGGTLSTDIGSVVPYLPAYRANGNELRVKIASETHAPCDEQLYDVQVVVKKRVGYID